jgi:prepilin-type N-terminal cleavage/methylation domain-containing protein
MQGKKAFTLIELMVAMGVIGILVTLSLAGITLAQRSQRDTQRKSALYSSNLQMIDYFTKNQTYPDTITLSKTSITFGGVSVPLSGPASPCTVAEAGGERVSSGGCTVYCYLRSSPSQYRIGINLETGGWIPNQNSGSQLGNSGACNDAQARFVPN